ncbi:related to Fe-containing alcohol dehydrogenase [Ramularia collo-cygni]|uniref:Related to Fe-containing alcohol dehydrogenase n=1 Tax=Ramularia collo-cygni TaxID=112498 RepID=A0A2D3VFR2_9PEZI|nr:related to Fe-containing alcohol dehydrogenase [Ramularia collo-cygni]CZT22971.1 related to Fe-containing alcohol dehydrogenase [Ramularia collo-cygni]
MTSPIDFVEEIYRPAFKDGYAYISYGLPFTTACAKHIDETFQASRVYIIASGSLARNTNHVIQLQKALGMKVVGTRIGMRPHTLWSEILEITKEAKSLDADILVTLGAGSLTDGAKIIALALANEAYTFEDLDRLHAGDDWSQQRNDIKKPELPIISIPTSLSGGEYSFLGGGTNDRTHQKHGFGHPTRGPALVILDPLLTTTTPENVWLQSGVRAVDHCVEGMCSLSSTPESDADAAAGLKLLVPGLLKCKANGQDVDARMKCQMGVIEAMKVVFQHGVPMGASHGIGHQLGPLGVGHGETSCILLPAVCAYNVGVNAERQRKVRDVLWADEDVARLFDARGLQDADLSQLLDVFIAELGMPRSLKAVGIGEDKLDLLAENSLRDRWSATNPRPLKSKEDVMEILKMVQG